MIKLCECGCGLEVKPNRRFISGHNGCKTPWKPKPEPQLCECGCGEYTNPGKRFISGHNTRVNNPMKRPEIAIKLSGDNNPMRFPDVVVKRSGDNHHMKNPEIAKKNAEARKGPRLHERGKNSPNYKPEIDIWLKENQGKHICQCGCGGIVEIKRCHYPNIPVCLHGHTLRTEEAHEKRLNSHIRFNQNKRWDAQIINFINGNPITDWIQKPSRHYGISQEEYDIWRHEVYERDRYTCRICGVNHCEVHAHHIIPQRINQDLILDINNGITMCRECHELTYGKEELFIDELQMIINGTI